VPESGEVNTLRCIVSQRTSILLAGVLMKSVCHKRVIMHLGLARDQGRSMNRKLRERERERERGEGLTHLMKIPIETIAVVDVDELSSVEILRMTRILSHGHFIGKTTQQTVFVNRLTSFS
jgi:hypothetical protein